MALDLLFTIFLVLLNGFFVAAEFAIVKVRSSQIEVRKGVNQGVAKVAKNVISNLDGYLAATQLGITIASLGLGWVGESVFTEIAQNAFRFFGLDTEIGIVRKISVITAFLSITILHIVFGELAPKSLAIRKSTKVTFATAVPLHLFYIIFRPFIWLLNGFANLILRLMGIEVVKEQEDVHSEEELKVIIAESHKGGILEETERSLIQNVFSLGDRTILSLMTPRKEIVWLDLNDSVDSNKEKIANHKHNVYPVCKGDLDDIIGFVYSKDLLGNDFEENLKNLESLVKEIVVVISSNKAYQVLERFQKERRYQAVVVDEFGNVRGFVTINDIVDALVGDISETDEFEYSIKKQEDTLLVDGQIPFVEFIERVKPEYADEGNADFTTLAGYVINQLARLPEVGDTVEWHEFLIEVYAMDRNRVDKLLIRKNTND